MRIAPYRPCWRPVPENRRNSADRPGRESLPGASGRGKGRTGLVVVSTSSRDEKIGNGIAKWYSPERYRLIQPFL